MRALGGILYLPGEQFSLAHEETDPVLLLEQIIRKSSGKGLLFVFESLP